MNDKYRIDRAQLYCPGCGRKCGVEIEEQQ
jgi:hypothetical protein